MTKKNVQAAHPHEALPEGETNRYLAKFKSSLCKRWALTRMETLYEIFDLVAFLWALERNDEALAIAASVAASVPAPPRLGDGFNYNIWCPATPHMRCACTSPPLDRAPGPRHRAQHSSATLESRGIIPPTLRMSLRTPADGRWHPPARLR